MINRGGWGLTDWGGARAFSRGALEIRVIRGGYYRLPIFQAFTWATANFRVTEGVTVKQWVRYLPFRQRSHELTSGLLFYIFLSRKILPFFPSRSHDAVMSFFWKLFIAAPSCWHSHVYYSSCTLPNYAAFRGPHLLESVSDRRQRMEHLKQKPASSGLVNCDYDFLFLFPLAWRVIVNF